MKVLGFLIALGMVLVALGMAVVSIMQDGGAMIGPTLSTDGPTVHEASVDLIQAHECVQMALISIERARRAGSWGRDARGPAAARNAARDVSVSLDRQKAKLEELIVASSFTPAGGELVTYVPPEKRKEGLGC